MSQATAATPPLPTVPIPRWVKVEGPEAPPVPLTSLSPTPIHSCPTGFLPVPQTHRAGSHLKIPTGYPPHLVHTEMSLVMPPHLASFPASFFPVGLITPDMLRGSLFHLVYCPSSLPPVSTRRAEGFVCLWFTEPRMEPT